jgi:hypothetical protein
MSLDKSIESGKEKRKPYRKSKAIDRTCRNHGSCPWCEGNRLHNSKSKKEQADDQIEEYKKEPEDEK